LALCVSFLPMHRTRRNGLRRLPDGRSPGHAATIYASRHCPSSRSRHCGGGARICRSCGNAQVAGQSGCHTDGEARPSLACDAPLRADQHASHSVERKAYRDPNLSSSTPLCHYLPLMRRRCSCVKLG
jgi:hypothetical protein